MVMGKYRSQSEGGNGGDVSKKSGPTGRPYGCGAGLSGTFRRVRAGEGTGEASPVTWAGLLRLLQRILQQAIHLAMQPFAQFDAHRIQLLLDQIVGVLQEAALQLLLDRPGSDG